MNARQEPSHILDKDTRYLFFSYKNGSQSGKLCKFLNDAFAHTHGKQTAELKPFCSADECPYTEILFPDGHSVSSFTP